jgi:hypothetical protein
MWRLQNQTTPTPLIVIAAIDAELERR